MKSYASACWPAAMVLGLGLLAPAAGHAAAAEKPKPDITSAGLATAPPYPAAAWKKLDPASLLIIDTSKGRVIVELRPELSKEHVDRIKDLARQGYYDGLKFFRVINEFMAQTGDKANNGAGDSGLPTLKGAFSFRRGMDLPIGAMANPKGGQFGFVGGMAVYSQPEALAMMTADNKVKTWGAFCAGVAGMARTDVEDSASTQFFLMRQDFPKLDDQYTPWGRVVAGLDVVRALAVGEPPANPDTMTRVRMASDLPAAEQPNVWRVDTTSAAFKARMAVVASAQGPMFSPCDIEVPSEVRK